MTTTTTTTTTTMMSEAEPCTHSSSPGPSRHGRAPLASTSVGGGVHFPCARGERSCAWSEEASALREDACVLRGHAVYGWTMRSERTHGLGHDWMRSDGDGGSPSPSELALARSHVKPREIVPDGSRGRLTAREIASDGSQAIRGLAVPSVDESVNDTIGARAGGEAPRTRQMCTRLRVALTPSEQGCRAGRIERGDTSHGDTDGVRALC